MESVDVTHSSATVWSQPAPSTCGVCDFFFFFYNRSSEREAPNLQSESSLVCNELS